ASAEFQTHPFRLLRWSRRMTSDMSAEFKKKANGSYQHEYYVELCALAATGSLSESEKRQLDEHLVNCSECCESLNEFGRVVRAGIPLLAETREEVTEETQLWSQAGTKQDLFERIDRIERRMSPQIEKPPLLFRQGASAPLKYVAAGLVCLSLLAA